MKIQNPSQKPNYGDYVNLVACNGKYWCAEDGGGDGQKKPRVACDRSSAREWERFLLVNPIGPSGTPAIVEGRVTPVAFQTYGGWYLSAENGGGRELVANRRALGPWETFSLIGPNTPVPLLPIQSSRDDQITQGNFMHTSATMTESGQLTGSTHTWTTNPWQGVHAVSNVAFLDENMGLLWSSKDCACGVAAQADPTGPHDRVCSFSETVPGDVLGRIRAISIVHRTDPHTQSFDAFWRTDAGKAITVVGALVVLSCVLTAAGALAG